MSLYSYDVSDVEVVKVADIRHFIAIKRLFSKAQAHDYDSLLFTVIKLEYVKDETRSRRFIRYNFIEKKTIVIINNRIFLSSCTLLTNFSAKKQKYSRDDRRSYRI